MVKSEYPTQDDYNPRRENNTRGRRNSRMFNRSPGGNSRSKGYDDRGHNQHPVDLSRYPENHAVHRIVQSHTHDMKGNFERRVRNPHNEDMYDS